MGNELILVVVGIIFLGSLMRAVFGFGDSIVSMPLLALLPINLSTSIALVGLALFGYHFATTGVKAIDADQCKKEVISCYVEEKFVQTLCTTQRIRL